MIHVVKKWLVTVTFEGGVHEPVQFHISDDHHQGILRDIAKIDFGVARPVKAITIAADTVREPSMTDVTTVTGFGQGC